MKQQSKNNQQNQKSSTQASQTQKKSNISTIQSATKSFQQTKKSTKSINDQNKISAKKPIIKGSELKKSEQNTQQMEQQFEESKSQIFNTKQQEISDVKGEVTLLYSHYKSKFQIINGKISDLDIDNEYCLSSAFMGHFKIHLFDQNKQQINEQIVNDQTVFSGLVDGMTYKLQVEEDEIAEGNRQHKSYQAEKQVDSLRANRKEGCSCLFGNPCADNTICENWKDRFEVAKKNGWKGF